MSHATRKALSVSLSRLAIFWAVTIGGAFIIATVASAAPFL